MPRIDGRILKARADNVASVTFLCPKAIVEGIDAKVRTGEYRDRTDFLNQALREYFFDHNIPIKPMEAPRPAEDHRSGIDEALDHIDSADTPTATAAAPIPPSMSKGDLIAFYAGWLELQYNTGLKEEALKNGFRELLESRHAEICAAFDLESGRYLSFAELSAPIVEGIKATDPLGNHNLKLDNMLTDLINEPKDRRKKK